MITVKDVQDVARLARLSLTDDECQRFTEQLDRIIGYFDELNQVDTTGVEPMTHARDLALRLRDDRVTEPDRRADYQVAAPAVEGGLYLVPKVIE